MSGDDVAGRHVHRSDEGWELTFSPGWEPDSFDRADPVFFAEIEGTVDEPGFQGPDGHVWTTVIRRLVAERMPALSAQLTDDSESGMVSFRCATREPLVQLEDLLMTAVNDPEMLRTPIRQALRQESRRQHGEL